MGDNWKRTFLKLLCNRVGYYQLIKESIHCEDITIIKMYASNVKKPMIYEANVDGTEERSTQFYNNRWKL